MSSDFDGQRLITIGTLDVGTQGHWDISYIVSGTTPFWAPLLVHFSQCLFNRIFFSFWRKLGNERSNFFFIFEILKGGFRKKKKLKKLKLY